MLGKSALYLSRKWKALHLNTRDAFQRISVLLTYQCQSFLVEDQRRSEPMALVEAQIGLNSVCPQ